MGQSEPVSSFSLFSNVIVGAELTHPALRAPLPGGDLAIMSSVVDDRELMLGPAIAPAW